MCGCPSPFSERRFFTVYARINLLVLLFFSCAKGQSPLAPEAARLVNRGLDAGVEGSHLNCRIEPKQPFLDFAFRFESGYLVYCPVKLFGGEATKLYDFVRITPDSGRPVILGQGSIISAMPSNMKADVNIGKLKSEIMYTGAFAVGEGRYSVDVLVETNGRFIQKRWHIDVRRGHRERSAEIALPPRTVAPITDAWDGRLGVPQTPLHLTILLDAAPVNPYALKLRAWDRALLLDTLSSVLKQIECTSARLVAFNLDQQREIFREDRLDSQGWMNLEKSLRDLELGAVSLSVLKDRQGWSDLLVQILNKEITSPEPSDAVILLGPTTRMRARIPSILLPAPKESKPEFFYIDYCAYGLSTSEFPDTLAQITRQLGGNVLKIHSPGELARAIKEIQTRLESTRSSIGSIQ